MMCNRSVADLSTRNATMQIVSVVVALHHELAKHRTLGISFDRTWPLAIDVPLSRDCDGGDWSLVIQSTVGAWREAYERRPLSAANARRQDRP
jgi:hypothetical protein